MSRRLVYCHAGRETQTGGSWNNTTSQIVYIWNIFKLCFLPSPDIPATSKPFEIQPEQQIYDHQTVSLFQCETEQ